MSERTTRTPKTDGVDLRPQPAAPYRPQPAGKSAQRPGSFAPLAGTQPSVFPIPPGVWLVRNSVPETRSYRAGLPRTRGLPKRDEPETTRRTPRVSDRSQSEPDRLWNQDRLLTLCRSMAKRVRWAPAPVRYPLDRLPATC